MSESGVSSLVLVISEQEEIARSNCSLTSGAILVFILDHEQRIVQVRIPDRDRYLRNHAPAGGSHRATYSPSIDMAYVEIVPVRDGGVESTDGCFDLPMATIVNADLDEHDRIIGLEFDGASAALPRVFLERATVVD